MCGFKAPFLIILPWFSEQLLGQDLGAVDVSRSNGKYRVLCLGALVVLLPLVAYRRLIAFTVQRGLFGERAE